MADKRPELNKSLDSAIFLEYYYLKEELVAFCKTNGLALGGTKAQITKRIAHYLDTGENLLLAPAKPKVKPTVREITKKTKIEPDFICTEKHRAFFKAEIGKSFTFNVAFQKWLKNNAGKTYADAITAYYTILKDRKTEKTVIDKQFEYNTYIRDFFADNIGLSLQDAIFCWKYKKSQKGHNRYEKEDIAVLEKRCL